MDQADRNRQRNRANITELLNLSEYEGLYRYSTTNILMRVEESLS